MSKITKKEIEAFFNESLKDKVAINSLKTASVSIGMYDVAAKIRAIETENFPPNKQEREAEELRVFFGLFGVKIDPELAWGMYQASLLYKKRKGKSDLEDFAKIKADMEKYFHGKHKKSKDK